MVSVGRHENITLLSNSEVESVSGFVGNFTVKVRRKPRYVDEETCTGCGTCVDACPSEAIEMIDGKAVVDPEKCVDCGVCVDECPVEAIHME